jgi:hypothetical protein
MKSIKFFFTLWEIENTNFEYGGRITTSTKPFINDLLSLFNSRYLKQSL